MKKVFAFLSVFALTIAFVGFGAKSANADSSLFTEDPTLSENQIPMYIMDSIYTTFPNYYDYATGGDSKWQGASRMYPWNETRLQVKLIDEDGNWVMANNGQVSEYAIYFSGSTTAASAGAGNNLLFYDVDADGNPVMRRLSADGHAKYDKDGNIIWDDSAMAMDPSLSHMRTNISDQDIVFDSFKLFEDFGGGDARHNLTNRAFVFDADGRMIRGIALDGGYLLPDDKNAQPVTIAPEYCYVEKVDEEGNTYKEVAKIEDGTQCAVVHYDATDTEPEKDVVDYVTSRFVWQYFDAEDFDSETVNDVPYLSEGWDAEKWDYANQEGDGYICIAFVSAEGSAFKLTADQLEVYKETCAANGWDAPTEATIRSAIRKVYVPAGGWTYDFGYLDKGKVDLCNKFMDMFIDGYYYGRKVDENGKGMAYQSTHDFSTKPIYATDIQNNGVSYQVMEGQNVIEVLQGETVYPTKNVVYSGMARYWQTSGDLLSYQSDTSVLEMYVTENGLTKVQPNTGYTSMQEVIDDFLTDVADWKGVDVSAVAFDTAENFQGNFSWGSFFPTNSANAGKLDYPSAERPSFWNIQANREKWSWLIEEIYNTMVKYPGGDSYTVSLSHVNDAKSSFFCGSPQTIAYAFWYFLNGQQNSWFGLNFQDGHNVEWLDTRTNLQKWNQYTIDTSTAAVDTNYVVEYKVYNPNTNLETSLTLTYVVVDEYTPILKVNKSNLFYYPTVIGETVTMPTIDEYTFCTAYNARYNGSSIKGDDISYKVHYTSETLDFDNPTEGEHEVTAVVYNQTKWAEKKFVVYVEDVTAPRVFANDVVTIGVGEYFDVLDGIVYAYDNVDGNLLDLDRNGWYEDVSVKRLDVTKVGKYNVTLEVWDASGNTSSVSYTVNVVSNQVNENLAESVAQNKQEIENVKTLVIEQFEELNEKIDAIQAEFDSKCGSKNALVVEFLAATSLLVVFLRKRH